MNDLITVGRFREKAIERGILIEPAIHIVVADGLFVSALKRLTRRKTLFLYYHRRARTFVLASWLNDRRRGTLPLCVELEAYPQHPDTMRIDVWEMVTRIGMTHDAQLRAMKEKVMHRRTTERLKRAEELEERNEMVEGLKKRGLIGAAAMLDTGMTPFHSTRNDPQALEMKQDILNHGKDLKIVDMNTAPTKKKES